MFRLCLFREARNCILEAKRGVAHVLLNRMKNPKGPFLTCKTILSNILCPRQFSSFGGTDYNSRILPNPDDPVEWSAWLECCVVADDPGRDPTGGANYYHSYQPGHPNYPAWADEERRTAQIGPFSFYKL